MRDIRRRQRRPIKWIALLQVPVTILLMAGCGRPSGAPRIVLPTIEAPVATVTPTPLGPEQQTVVAAARSYASRMGDIRAAGIVRFDDSEGSAVIEVLFDNGQRWIYVLARDPSSAWSVISLPTPEAG